MWTDGPRCCCCCFFSPPLIFDLPNAFEWPSSRQHRHLTPARDTTMTRRRRGGTSCPSVIRYNLFPSGRSIFVLRTFFPLVLLRALDFEWPVSLNPLKPVNQTSDLHAHTRRTSHLFISPRGGVSACALTGGCNTAQRWHFRNLLNNSKSVT